MKATLTELARWKAISEKQYIELMALARRARSQGEQSRYAVRAHLVQIEIDKLSTSLSAMNTQEGVN